MAKEALSPEALVALREQAGSCWEAQEYTMGLKIINRVLAINDQDPASFNIKAVLLIDLERTPESIEYFETGMQLAIAQEDTVNQYKIHRNYAAALKELGDDEGAINHRLKALKLATALENIDYQIAILPYLAEDLKAAERYEEAIVYYKRVVKFPDKWGWNEELAECYKELGRYEEAYAVWTELLAHDSRDILYRYGQAECLIALGQEEKAAKLIKDIVVFAITEPKVAYANITLEDGNIFFEKLEDNLYLIPKYFPDFNMELLSGEESEVTETAATARDDTSNPLFKQFMKQMQAQIKANAEAVEKAAADAAAAALEAARATATAGAAGAAAAHLGDVALTVENSPHLARLQVQEEMKAKYLAEINADKATKEYFHAFQTYVNENFASFKVSRGEAVDMSAAGGIPCAGAIGGLLPPPGGTILTIFNTGIKTYQTVKAKNGFARASDLVVGISAFEGVSEAVALQLSVDHRTRILEATTSNKGILKVWNKISYAKNRLLVNNYDTAAKKLAMQDGLMLLSAMKAGCFDGEQDLAMQFVSFISDERMMLCMDGKMLATKPGAVQASGKCTIMCVTDIVYENPLLNDAELREWLAKYGKLSEILDITVSNHNAVQGLTELVASDGLIGLQAWEMSLSGGCDADCGAEF